MSAAVIYSFGAAEAARTAAVGALGLRKEPGRFLRCFVEGGTKNTARWVKKRTVDHDRLKHMSVWSAHPQADCPRTEQWSQSRTRARTADAEADRPRSSSPAAPRLPPVLLPSAGGEGAALHTGSRQSNTRRREEEEEEEEEEAPLRRGCGPRGRGRGEEAPPLGRAAREEPPIAGARRKGRVRGCRGGHAAQAGERELFFSPRPNRGRRNAGPRRRRL
ncbi:unnamed protein product [Prorocentrum cordatum]|uniref:Uncharacterized protein n=1 Tax=Prorocentrum cordatum TaxID=2364126 RepID=A0ABN9U6I1_9DINO|nr:unnamed protein product [Polarella glacialis]